MDEEFASPMSPQNLARRVRNVVDREPIRSTCVDDTLYGVKRGDGGVSTTLLCRLDGHAAESDQKKRAQETKQKASRNYHARRSTLCVAVSKPNTCQCDGTRGLGYK